MQLISTTQYHEPSTEYCTIPFLLDQEESVRDTSAIQSISGFAPLSISDLVRETEEETSVFLRTVKYTELLGSFYTFDNPIEVKRFLLRHDNLITSLFEVNKQIKRVFEESIVDICLEYDRDPEENFEGLSVIIKTSLSPELSLDLLDKFDEDWWLWVEDEIRMKVTVMVRPV